VAAAGFVLQAAIILGAGSVTGLRRLPQPAA
jgi:hypothetical protein